MISEHSKHFFIYANNSENIKGRIHFIICKHNGKFILNVILTLVVKKKCSSNIVRTLAKVQKKCIIRLNVIVYWLKSIYGGNLILLYICALVDWRQRFLIARGVDSVWCWKLQR